MWSTAFFNDTVENVTSLVLKSDSIFSSSFVKSVCGNVCRNNSKLCHYFCIIVLHANTFS